MIPWIVLMALGAGLLAVDAQAQDVILRGFVTDASTGQPLTGANVLLQRLDVPQALPRGIATATDGLYQIPQLAPGRYAFQVSYVGYLPHTDTLQLGDRSVVTRNAALVPDERELEQVTVEAEEGATQLEAGFQRIRPADLARIPTPGPGGDLTMYLQSLPSVVAIGDRGGQLFIRGGTPSQNMVLLDGTVVYQPFHIVGFFSAFPQDLIADVKLYAGGFPARYAERISSVIDVTTRSGNNQSFAGSVSAGPFLTGVTLEGPVAGAGSPSFLVSMRTSVIEETSSAIVGEGLPLKFGDQFVKLQSTGSTGRCSLSGLHTYDRGRIDAEGDDVFSWSNYVLAGRCLTFSSFYPLTTEVTGGFSYFENEVGGVDEDVRTADDARDSGIWRMHTNVDLTYPLADTEMTWGFRVRANNLNYRLREFFQGIGTGNSDFMIAIGMHGGLSWRPDDRLTVSPSLALTLPLGSPLGFEPRVRASWRPGGSGAHQLSAAAGLYRQVLLGLNDERDAGSLFTAWLFAEEAGRTPTAGHAILGWRSDLGAGFGASVEGYYKDLRGLLVPEWDTNARFTTSLAPATGTSYGLDLRLDYERGPFYGYVGYGYAQTTYRLAQENFSAWFSEPVQEYRPPHDRRHQINVVASLDLGRRWLASARWQYGSGLPYTPPIGFDAWFDLRLLPDVRNQIGRPRFLFEKPYGGRLPAYHRLDVSAERTFDLDVADLTLELGAINLYDRANLFYFDLFTQRRVDQLPLIPYLSVQLSTP